ncbi:nucleotide exchange factor GrpE [bacterium]|nr:nucleotide exchange factor GrpE [bacterium]
MDENNSNPFKNDETDKEIDINETIDKADDETKDDVKNDEEELVKDDLQEKYDILNNQYIRLAADFDNYRKRQEQERENLIKFGTENALTKLIEVLDNFERGQKSLENVDDCAKVKESFDLIQKQVYETLTKLGLEEIKAVGEEFDPNFHEAVMQTPTSEHKEHTVIAELRKGYKYGDKVLRPTMVNVATAE